jgi:hypothetical protein
MLGTNYVYLGNVYWVRNVCRGLVFMEALRNVLNLAIS